MKLSTLKNRLNIGCGQQFHLDWTNVDLVPHHRAVIRCDITAGLPFDNQSFDVVYHSHLLEHLCPADGRQLIQECERVLRPGGVLRIVVPDLEQIAKLYLEKHELAWQNESSSNDYRWIKLELLDQMVRSRSGGQMGQYLASKDIENIEFVRQRMGQEIGLCRAEDSSTEEGLRNATSWRQNLAARWLRIRKRIARETVRLLLGKKGVSALQEGIFRSQGEVHRWMYDRYSLRKLLTDNGFGNVQIQSADSSLIAGFVDYELDTCGGEVRKPDSIFVEAIKKKSP